MGSLLDRYFELTAPPYDPKRIWKWTENLNYHEQKSADYCKSIHVLQHDNTLRQGIISHVFGKLTDSNQIFETKIHKFDLHSHSGLRFLADDYRFIIDLSFETGNSSLWASFMARHQYYRKKPDQGADTLRRQMRMQALKDPRLMREWSRFNRAAAQSQRENRKTEFRYARKIKRTRKQWQDIRTSNKKYIQANQKLIESGRHWNSLVHFAELILMSPNEIEQQIGDELIVRTALRNCLDFIAPEVPDLFKLAKLQCASQGKVSETVLFAACVEIMRAEGNLERVDLRLLNALRTHIDMSYSAISGEERDTLKTEVDRLIFSDVGSAERFLRQYVEPQLAEVGCPHPEIWLLRSDKVFSHLRGALSIEWLHRFRGLGLSPLSTLFEVAAQSGNRIDLQKIIAERCASFMFEWPSLTDNSDIERERIFWLVRALYFLEDTPETYWNWLKADRETIFLLNSQSGRINHDDNSYWPALTLSKIEAILDAFIDKWPKVDLPSNWGSESPNEEHAYRFLTELTWSINKNESDEALLVVERLIADPRFTNLHKNLRSIQAGKIRQNGLRDFEPPTPREIVNRLDSDAVVTVEGLRQLVIQELQEFQKSIDGGEFNSGDRFYEKGERLGEVRSTLIISERLNLRLEPKGISITPEHQLKDANRSDFTATKMIRGKRRLLVTEVKGQWHKDLYTAAAAQLYERYSIHPDAEQQGIFLAIWFGATEEVAGRKKHGIKTAQELKCSIEASLPPGLIGLVEVFVLDVSCAYA